MVVGRARTGGPAAGRGVRFAFRSLSVILVCIVYVRATTMLVDTEAYTEQRTKTFIQLNGHQELVFT